MARVIDTDGHEVTLNVRKDEFANAAIRFLRTASRTPAGASDVKNFVREVVAVAEKKPMVQVGLRVAGDQNRFVYNTGNSQGDCIVVTADGWTVDRGLPEQFKRYPVGGQQDLPSKTDKADLADLFKYINIRNQDEQVLFLVYLIACFVPHIIHPCLVLYGGQGTAKSTASRVFKLMVDPSAVEIHSLNGSMSDIVQFLAHHYVCTFDNLDKLTNKQSDLFCQAVTGGTMSKRALYSDDDDVVLPFKGVLVLNGINIVAPKSDLLDRALPFEFQRIDEKERRDEITLMREFREARPRYLATIFDTLAAAIKAYPEITLEQSPRLADFYRWGHAIAFAMGGDEMRQKFAEAFAINRSQMHRSAIASNTLAEAVVDFMGDILLGVWEGNISDFRSELLEDYAAYNIPKTPNWLSRSLKEISENLKSEGIEIEWGKDTSDNTTRIKITDTRRISIPIPAVPIDIQHDGPIVNPR